LREGLKEERTSCINRIRGLLAEFGVVLPQSSEVLREHLSDVIEAVVASTCRSNRSRRRCGD
jgi:transposase